VLSDRARYVPTAQVNPTMAASDCIRMIDLADSYLEDATISRAKKTSIATKWLSKAADRGDVDAQRRLLQLQTGQMEIVKKPDSLLDRIKRAL
jgi:TPR repeat protein